MQNFHKYLNVSNLEKEWGFYLTTVGFAKIGANKSYPDNREHPVGHSFTWDKGRILDGYYLVFITKGEGIMESANNTAYKVSEGTCFFLFPGVWHRYKPNPRSGWEEYWVGFNGAYPAELMNSKSFCQQQPFVNVGMNDDLLQLFHHLNKTVAGRKPGYRQIITGITLQILGLVNSIAKYDSLETANPLMLISKAKFLLQESIEMPVNVEEIAKELPMGYSRFRKLFKQTVGMSPNQYHLNLRLVKARELLISTSLSINEIAFQTGFESIFYFSRLFKAKNGLPPKEYRSSKTQGAVLRAK